MKITIVVIGLLTLLLNISAQNVRESDVPAVVKSKFSSMYPAVTNAKWEIENGSYEAEFKENSMETSVIINANGTYVQTEKEIAVSSLPKGVSDYAVKNLRGKTINEASLITAADGSLSYEAEIGKKDYLFDANGNFLKAESDSNDSEDDDK